MRGIFCFYKAVFSFYAYFFIVFIIFVSGLSCAFSGTKFCPPHAPQFFHELRAFLGVAVWAVTIYFIPFTQ